MPQYDPCPCESWLTKYVIGYVENPERFVNHDFIREHGVIIDQYERLSAVIAKGLIGEPRLIHAFTIAEAFRLVAFEQNRGPKPKHRILNEDLEEINECIYRNPQKAIEEARQKAIDAVNRRIASAGTSQIPLG